MPAIIEVETHDGLHVLRMRSGENRFNGDFLDALGRALDEIERAEPRALVTIGEGKFYSNGLDLEWMLGEGSQHAQATVRRVEQLFIRLLTFPTITIAALNGHVFAAGAMLALAHDFRVMRTDRGFFCLPEVDIQFPFTVLMSELVKARLPKLTAHEAMVTGRRYNAEQALAAQIVHQVALDNEVLTRSLDLARTHAGKHGPTLATIKQVAHRDLLAILASAGRDGS